MPDEPQNPYAAVLQPNETEPGGRQIPPSERPSRIVLFLDEGGGRRREIEIAFPGAAPPTSDQLRQRREDDRQRERGRLAKEQHWRAWGDRLDDLRTDPRLLKRCLDENLRLPRHADGYPLLWLVSRTADALRVGAGAMRAALELVALWSLPPQATDDAPAPMGARLIEAAVWYAARYDAAAVYTAVHGDIEHGHYGRGWKAVPWAVLKPLAAFKGYDDRSITGGRVAVCYGPPQETTYRGLPILSQGFQDLLSHLRGAEKAIKSVYEWSCAARRGALEGDAPLSSVALDALAHPIRPAATLTLAAAEGTEVSVTASEPTSPRDAVPFSSNDVGRHLEGADGRAIITAVESSTRATVRILAPFTTIGPISAGEWGIERVSREEFQRMANEEREEKVDRYFRVGDRVLDVPLIQELDTRLAKLCELTPAVEKKIDSITDLAGARPARFARGGGRNVAAYRTIAAEVAERINKIIPDPRRRSRVVDGISLDDYENHGLYRNEGLERSKAILHAVYGVLMRETDVKAAVQKGRSTKVNRTKK